MFVFIDQWICYLYKYLAYTIHCNDNIQRVDIALSPYFVGGSVSYFQSIQPVEGRQIVTRLEAETINNHAEEQRIAAFERFPSLS